MNSPLKLNHSLKNILIPKSNCNNTINKIVNDDIEIVKKLSYFDPNSQSHCLYNLEKIKTGLNSNSKALKFADNIKLKNKLNNNQKKKNLQINTQNLYDSKSGAGSGSDNEREVEKSDLSLPLINQTMSPKMIKIEEVNTNSNNSNSEGQDKLNYSKRIENLGIENKFETERYKVQTDIEKCKYDRKIVVESLLDVQNKIQTFKMKIELLNGMNTDKKAISNKLNIGNKFSRKNTFINNNSSDDEEMHRLLVLMQKEKDRREHEMEDYQKKIKEYIQIKNQNKRELEMIENNLKNFHSELSVIKNELMLHYHKILNEGLDTRHEGLFWVIKAIWNLGGEVIMSYLPYFLDEQGIDYLFEAAHKDCEMQNLKLQIDEIRHELRLCSNKNRNNKHRMAKKLTFFTTTDVINKI